MTEKPAMSTMYKTSNVRMSASGFNCITKSSGYFESKHKSRPSNFLSVFEARQKRTEHKSLHRKSARISTFDNARNMSPLAPGSPVPLTKAQAKSQRRRLLLQQWKQEKDKKKLEEAKTKKKKPFVVRAVHAPLAFEPPPALLKPSTSGRVTRSQTLRNKNQQSAGADKKCADSHQGRVVVSAADYFAKKKESSTSSFAPPNAVFHPPKLDMNFLVSTNDFTARSVKSRTTKQFVTFDPVVKTNQSAPLQKVAQNNGTSVGQSSQSRMPNRKNQSKVVNGAINRRQDQNQGTSVGPSQSRMPNQKTESKVVPPPRAGVLMPKDNNSRTVRVTRSNIMLESVDGQAATKQMQIKPQTKAKDKKIKEIAFRSQNTPTKKVVSKMPKSESRVEDKLRTPPQESLPQSTLELPCLSPCVTVTRGKHNSRIEAMNKMKDGLLGDDIGDEKTVDDFRRQLHSEISRMTAISEEWHKYAEINILPEHIQAEILVAVGQARLLMSQKLQQFSSLVELCASGQLRSEGAVTTSDLEGFWDMVFIQVEKVYMSFRELEELREQQWTALAKDKPQPNKKPVTNKNPLTNNKKAGAPAVRAPCKIKAFIQGARKAARQKNETTLLTPVPANHKDFNAGFFNITSPVRNTGVGTHTPRLHKASMLRDVLSSEARKLTSASKESASRAMMRASLISKCVDDPAAKVEASPMPSPPAIASEATPARSILKTPNPSARTRRSSRKSAKIVLFEDDDRSDGAGIGMRRIVVTPEKISEEPLQNSPEKQVSSTVTRRLKSPKKEQENLEPAPESPARRVTRQMRRSILQEKQECAVSTVELPAKDGRRSERRTKSRASSQLKEVH